MNQTQFDVSRFENRNGVTSWRVTGWMHGVRIRKNFKTREEAAAERSVLEIKTLQVASGLHSIATALTEVQVREAEALFQRVDGKGRPLSFYVDFALANYREPERQKPLADAIAEYVAAKEREFDQDHISRSQFERIRWDLKRLQQCFPGVAVAELTVPGLIAFLEVGHPAMKTYNNRRGILSTLLKFAFHRGWIVENPILRVPHHRIRRRRGSAQTLTAAQAHELMEYFEGFEGGRWVPYFALCLFAGIRPGVPEGEIAKLQPESVDLNAGTIFVAAEVSKVREPRRVAIQPNLAAWLRAYPLEKFPIVVGDFQKRRAKFKDKFRTPDIRPGQNVRFLFTAAQQAESYTRLRRTIPPKRQKSGQVWFAPMSATHNSFFALKIKKISSLMSGVLKFNLTHDVLRHTFISMFVAKFRSMGEAALQAGNSESIICRHYLDLKNPAEAEEFFSIMPTRNTTVETLAFPSPRSALAVAG